MSDAASETHMRPEDGSVYDEYNEKVPEKKKFYRNRKYWYICVPVTIAIVLLVVLLILFVGFPKIAQSSINGSSITVNKAQITFTDSTGAVSKRDATDGNSTFTLIMDGSLSNTGPFSATIDFDEISVYFNNTIKLGTINLPSTSVSGTKGSLSASTPFNIANEDDFANFAVYMMKTDSFVWTLKGGAHVTALGRTTSVTLDKDITMSGMNGFPNVTITSFNLPNDDPAGGIHMSLGTVLNNPSPVGVQLGTISLDVGYNGVYLGPVSASNVTLQSGANNIQLEGRMVPQTQAADLNQISQLFSQYVAGKPSNTTATGVSAAPDGVHPVSWLSKGFQSIQLDVTLAPNSQLKLITGINMGDLDLAFTNATAYSPLASAPNVTANFQMPFGFSMNITQVTQNITIGTNSTGPVANLQSGFVNSVSNQTAGILKFALANSPLVVIPGKESAFNDFNANLTAQDTYNFTVTGNASINAQTPIGVVTLTGIPFAADSNLNGLRNLNSSATIINSLDVVGGTTDYLQLAISVGMENPSSVQIGTGDVTFQMLSGDVVLGNVMLPNLTLARGPNTVNAQGTFDPKSSTNGQNLLTTFIEGKDNTVGIQGSNGTTPILSLVKSLEDITLSSVLHGLPTPLIQKASLQVLDDTLSTGYASTIVTMSNPFTAGFSITKVISAVTYAGMPVGNIDTDVGSNPITIGGKSTGNTPGLAIKMNLEPAAIALLLRENAASAGLDLQPLDGLLTLGGFSINGQQNVQASADVFNGFNVTTFVINAMKNLHIDLQLQSTLVIGQYVNDQMAFAQSDVVCQTDDSIAKLIPIVGQPIVQAIINGAQLSFSSVVISNPTDTNFQVLMNGKITGTGPFSASIAFPTPLQVAWEGRTLGSVSMATIQTQPDTGATFSVTGTFTITDGQAMTDFSAYMLNNEQFTWEITTNNVAVTALGYTFTGLQMQKSVSLNGMQGFKNDVTIQSFNLPANDPNGGIELDITTVIKNPSNVGVDLSGVGFESFFESIDLGPLASINGSANFPPNGESTIPMKGRLVPQSSADGLQAIQTIFGNFLSGKPTTLSVKGSSASGPSGQVSWLSKAFQSLTIDNIILPAGPSNLTLIPAVTLKQLSLDFTKDAYAPISSSSDVEAQFQSPFGFPLAITGLSQKIQVIAGGFPMANLDIPYNPATTYPNGTIVTSFSNVPFAVGSNVHEVFNQFVKQLTLTGPSTFGLSGTIQSTTETAVGGLNLGDITFNVQTSMQGFNNFGGAVKVNSVSVVGGTPHYVDIKLSVTLTSPSPISITIGDITFRTIAFGYDLGPTILKQVTINPGDNVYDAEFQLTPTADPTQQSIVGKVLSGYLMGGTFPLTVQGTTASSPIQSLQEGLAGVKLATSITGVPPTLITSTKVVALQLDIIHGTATATTYVTLNNPLDVAFSLVSLQAVITMPVNGATVNLAHINYNFPAPFTVGAKQQVTTAGLPLVFDASLAQLIGLVGTPEILVNIAQTATVIVGDGFGGILSYSQANVPSFLDPFSPATLAALNSTVAANASSSVVPLQSSSVSMSLPTTTTTDSAASATATTTEQALPTTTTDSAVTTDATTTTDAAATTTAAEVSSV
ncbi:hypothetical protein INT43_006783 [Umbelopsis isabellina]|uniref:Pre-rRNA processing protein n=1 Tax=Mortierella isabellina TaxID=91625 RepID=A0A8H7UJ92_MORIS|nr:hypothetical protein INT43_006783 [Umbelopsis isabellina]